MKTILIIPCFNEQANILLLYNKILDYNKKYKTKYDCLFINDGSTDNSKMILDNNKIPHIDLLSNLGIGGAVQTGYRFAYNCGYDIAVQFDGDGQHEISNVNSIIKPIEKGLANMVIGSRFIEKLETYKSTKSRRIGISLISIIIKIFTKKKICDPTSGFRAIDKQVLSTFANDYPIEYPEPVSSVILLKMNLKIMEVPVIMYERKNGKSSIRTWKNVYYMINIFISIMITSMRRYK